MFPAQPQPHMQQQMQHGQHARPKSKLPLFLAIGGVAIAGGVVAIVLAMKGGGGGGGASDPKAVAEQTIAAMGAGDVDKLIALTGMEQMYASAIKCDDTANEEDRDLSKAIEKSKKRFQRDLDKIKGVKLELASMPDLDKRDTGADIVLKKGEKMMKGCVSNADVRMVETKLTVKVDGKDQDAKLGLLQVDGKWYLIAPPDIQKGGNFDEQLAKMAGFRDKMCACADSTCGDATFKEMQAWTSANIQELDKAKPSADDMKKAAAITDDMTKCMMKITQGGAAVNAATPPPAEIATGSGAAASAGASGLPKECDDWGAAIDKLGSCAKYPKASAEALKKAYSQAADAWKKLPADTKAQLSTSCAQATKGILDGAKAMGCSF
jgi:hypothetical protein